MSESDPKKNTIERQAERAILEALDGGQSATIDGLSVSRVPLRDAMAVADRARKLEDMQAGRRPLFRGISLSGVR